MSHIINYLTSCQKQFAYYQMLGDKSMAQLSDAELFYQPNEASNSIAQIVKHMNGNMLSRWTDFLTTDGEKEWRRRDEEFIVDFTTREALMELWAAGWQCLYGALDSVTEENFDTIIYIRNQGHSITEAINRQLAHYSYHVGQIVYIARMLRDSDWQSLSIPKGQSKAYNADKFAQEKSRQHFTDEWMK